MQALLDVILPVFTVVGLGYLAVWRQYFSPAANEGLMRYAQGFAVPVLLFTAISNLDLSQGLDPAILISFYGGAAICFGVGIAGAYYLFGRTIEDSIAIGFVGLFSNSLLLGLSITERAYGTEALVNNYVIVSVHAPFCYALGITVMETAKARGQSKARLVPTVLKAMFSNGLIIGISLGLIVNLTGLHLPVAITDGLAMIKSSALPAALFALGGILVQYRPEGDLRIIAMLCVISLLLHPALVWLFGSILDLSVPAFRSAVLTSAMAPGVNAYLFANMYGRAQRVAASSVLLATALCILSVTGWLTFLP